MPINGVNTQVSPVNAPSSGAKTVDNNIDLIKPAENVLSTLSSGNNIDTDRTNQINDQAARIADDSKMSLYEKQRAIGKLGGDAIASDPKNREVYKSIIEQYKYGTDPETQKQQEQQSGNTIITNSALTSQDQYSPEQTQAHTEVNYPQTTRLFKATEQDLSPLISTFSNTKNKDIAGKIATFNTDLYSNDQNASGLVDKYHTLISSGQIKDPTVIENTRQSAERQIVSNASTTVASFVNNMVPIISLSPNITVEEAKAHYDVFAGDLLDNFAGTDFDTGKLDSYLNGPARDRAYAAIEASVNKDINGAKKQAELLKTDNEISQEDWFNNLSSTQKDSIYKSKALDSIVNLLLADSKNVIKVLPQGTVKQAKTWVQNIITDDGKAARVNTNFLNKPIDKIDDTEYHQHMIDIGLLSSDGKGSMQFNPGGSWVSDVDGTLKLLHAKIDSLAEKDDQESINNKTYLENISHQIENKYQDYKQIKDGLTGPITNTDKIQ